MKEIEFDNLSLWTLRSLNPLIDFHDSYINMYVHFNGVDFILNFNLEIRSRPWSLNPDFIQTFFGFWWSHNGYYHWRLDIDFVYHHNTISIPSIGDKVKKGNLYFSSSFNMALMGVHLEIPRKIWDSCRSIHFDM